MSIVLEKACIKDAQEIYELQTKSFAALLKQYQDYDYSPGAEKLERTIQRLLEPFTDFYFISLCGKHIGALRICDFDKICKLKQIFILPKYQENGYAQSAITIAENYYKKAERWELDTILQERKLCYLYEKMGYKKTGKTKHVKEGMDIVFYAK